MPRTATYQEWREGIPMRLGEELPSTCCTKGRHLKSMPIALCTLMGTTAAMFGLAARMS